MVGSPLQLDPRRLRSWVLRLPLFTRVLLGVIVLFWVIGTASPQFRKWTALTPSEVGLGAMHRLNTFPLIHLGIFHALLNILALAPLLERFEHENGTLVALVLFTGPFSTFPGIIYVLFEKLLGRGSASISGASIWVFLLLAVESIKTYRANPYFAIATYRIPTWATPLILILVTSVLVSNVSLIGHLCGAGIGYLWGLGYIKFLAPPEKILRWLEAKLNLLGRLPHYVSVDQKTYGRYGVLPNSNESELHNV